MKHFIGIEAFSARLSVGVLANHDGNVLAIRRGEPFSLFRSDRSALKAALIRLLHALIEGVAEFDWAQTTICFGVRGITFPYDAFLHFPDELLEIGFNIPKSQLICTGDAEIITAASTQADTAAAIIAHEGSTAYVYKNRRSNRLGGWGPQLGDEGSAFDIGRSAVRRLLWEYERGENTSVVLWSHIKQWLDAPEPPRPYWVTGADRWKRCITRCRENGHDERTALFTLVNSFSMEDAARSNALLSGLAIPVIRASAHQDTIAREIIEKAGTDLAAQLVTLLRNLDVHSSTIPIILYGGLFEHNKFFQDIVLERISINLSSKQLTVISPGNDNVLRPVYGALLFAFAQSTNTELKIPPPEIVQALRKSVRSLHYTTTQIYA